jgi:hypothetical protein
VVLLSEAGVGKDKTPIAKVEGEGFLPRIDSPKAESSLQVAEEGLLSCESSGGHTPGAEAHDDSAGFLPGINPRPTARLSASAASSAPEIASQADTPALESAPASKRAALAPALWLDPDVRWLTGVHEAKGHAYLVRERYEELLWWLLMPALLRLAGEPSLDRSAIAEMDKTVEEALSTAEAAGYRIDVLLEPIAAAVADEIQTETQPPKPDKTDPVHP